MESGSVCHGTERVGRQSGGSDIGEWFVGRVRQCALQLAVVASVDSLPSTDNKSLVTSVSSVSSVMCGLHPATNYAVTPLAEILISSVVLATAG